MKNLILSLTVVAFCLLFSLYSTAQNVGINETGAAPDNSAMLDLKSDDKGFLITRVDTANIASPAFGLMTLAPEDSCLYMSNGTTSGKKWISIGGVGSNCSCSASSSLNNLSIPIFDDHGLLYLQDNRMYANRVVDLQYWKFKKYINSFDEQGSTLMTFYEFKGLNLTDSVLTCKAYFEGKYRI